MPKLEIDPEFHVQIETILKTLELSNGTYRGLLEKQRALEEERGRLREKAKMERGLWRKIRDTLVPA